MVYLFLGKGFEEAEAICTIDILRRCGIDVKTVSVMEDIYVQGAHSIIVKADMLIDAICDDADMYVLPGGTLGVENMSECQKLCEILLHTKAKIAAICAAPTLLAKLGLLDRKFATCYPSLTHELKGAIVTRKSVVTDTNLITSMGPGTSFDFGFALAQTLTDKKTVEEVKAGMLIK